MQDLIRLAGFTTSKYYKGGFERKMSRREAALILGVPQSSSKSKIREAYKRIMLLNHPDRGGSPYLASKINEAKEYLENESLTLYRIDSKRNFSVNSCIEVRSF
ncbi:hypothetical protein TcWFU_004492 [Taenia crassiceps]|uniref:J domain-containing protein n=1 Tax=Taenia crassiceps TaxID=6207 RepID=A0ABR4Q4Y4_9CEST